MQAEILLTLKLQQRVFADPRRIELLKQVKINRFDKPRGKTGRD